MDRSSRTQVAQYPRNSQKAWPEKYRCRRVDCDEYFYVRSGRLQLAIDYVIRLGSMFLSFVTLIISCNL